MKMAAMGGEIGCVTLVIVLAAVFGGLWLDRLLGTKPILTVIFVLGAGPLALVITYWLAMRAVKDSQEGEKMGTSGGAGKEKEIGE